MLHQLVDTISGGDGAEEGLPPLAYALLTLALFAVLLLVTYAFRSVGNRHDAGRH